MKIDRPGIYRGILDADYREDPCPTPSLTQSLCKIINDRSPQHAWAQNVRLNPGYEPDDDPKFDIGNAAHRLVLGRGKDFVIVDAADWRTKSAKDARAAAAEDGRIGILSHQFEKVSTMAQATFRHLGKHEDSDAFTEGDAEVMICWEENGIWFRSLIDWLHTDMRTVDDFKSTGMSVAPHVLGLRAEAGGWDVQAAFIERGLDILDPAGAGRRLYRFIAQETDEPHALNVMHMSEHWLTMGRKKVQHAIDRWTYAIRSGIWAGYPKRSVTPEYPGFKENQWLQREIKAAENDTSLIMAG